MNTFQVLQNWFSESPGLFLSCLTLTVIGFLSAGFWIMFVLNKLTFDVRLTLAGAISIVLGVTFVGHHYHNQWQCLGMSLSIVGGVITLLYWLIKWIKWGNGW